MKLYLAAIFWNFPTEGNIFERLTPIEKAARIDIENILESYHYVGNQLMTERIRRSGRKVFFDSGAFSAYTRGAQLDLQTYCRYLQYNSDLIAVEDGVMLASVMDGIGDPQLTYENQLAMESFGVKPLPCFHYGEDERWLEWYMSRYDYITIGGMVPISTPQLVLWLDRIWEKYLCDGNGLPRVKVHGFGMTSLPLMKRYPWHSVDSSTWVQWAANGMVLIPGMGQINISAKSSSRKIDGQHLTTYPVIQQQVIIDEIERLGYSAERLADDYAARWAFNCHTFPVEGRKSTIVNFKRAQPELF